MVNFRKGPTLAQRLLMSWFDPNSYTSYPRRLAAKFPGSIAKLNRWTNEPHQNRREITRRLRQIPFAKVSAVQGGTVLVADRGFTCLQNGEALVVEQDDHGLFVPCRDGRHYLDGQLEDGDRYIGLRFAVGSAK